MRIYTKKELKTLHSITLNVLYKERFPGGNYFANNHLLYITDSEMIEKILKDQRKRQIQLKESTIKSYSTKQILKHLDKFQDKYLTIAPFRIDFSYNEVRLYDSVDRAYYFFCSTEDRTTVLEALNTVYSLVK